MSPPYSPRPVPTAEELALMPVLPNLPPDRVAVLRTAADAPAAWAVLQQADAWGFDTESKPTFHRDQVSDGPHTVQLATDDRAWVIQLHDPQLRRLVGQWLAHPGVVKAGFGLGDDLRRIRRALGVEPCDVVELNTLMRAQGYRREMGVKASVAVLLGQRMQKSKSVATTNWAQAVLSPQQVAYSAQDAHAALRVYRALNAAGALPANRTPPSDPTVGNGPAPRAADRQS